MEEKVLLEEMSWEEVQEAIQRGVKTVVFTLGAIEQHGPHLPLGTDNLIADEIGLRIVKKIGNALLAPTIKVGLSDMHMDFPGTIALRKEVLKEVVIDYCESLARHRFKNIVPVVYHGGNFPAVEEEVVNELRDKLKGVNLIVFNDMESYLETFFKTAAKYNISREVAGPHGGESETSMILALHPDLVNMGRARAGFLGDLNQVLSIIFEKGMKALAENGVTGDPTRASREVGETYLEDMANLYTEFIKERLEE